MKKKTGIFLIIGIVLALMLTGCGKQSVETETAHTTEEDKPLNEKLTSTFSLFCSTLGTGGGS